jgi:hypothetical protein
MVQQNCIISLLLIGMPHLVIKKWANQAKEGVSFLLSSSSRKWLAPKHFLSYDPAILYCHHEESSFGPVICALCY